MHGNLSGQIRPHCYESPDQIVFQEIIGLQTSMTMKIRGPRLYPTTSCGDLPIMSNPSATVM
jgi:hypothetical protein